MPRALTEKEKSAQYRKLLDKGKKEVISHGIKKVSVDDIAKVAGIAKGTFYKY
jgi:AcrR family transcriptional regulator